MMDDGISRYQFISDLKNLAYVEEIMLYGSRARGDSRARSDIDIAILCTGANDKEWQNIIKIVENADTLLKIDYVRYDKLTKNNPLKLAIDRDKKVLYRKTDE